MPHSISQAGFGDRLRRYVQVVYNNSIRPYTPRKARTCNGVEVRDIRLFDQSTEWPDYEETLIERMGATVTPEDHVGIIGGGRGVSAVYAARLGGHVTVYEAGEEQASLVEDTVQRAGVADNVDVIHGLVGPAIDVWGDHDGAENIEPADLPEFDVIVLDCEGSETDIIPEIDAETAIVETHNWLGVPASDTKAELEANGYTVVDEQIDSPEYENKIVTAEKSEA